MSSPKVSVIICCYTLSRLGDIHEAVNSVLAQEPPPHEVILSVDHNSELLERLRDETPHPVRLVLNGRARGLSETRNVGIRAATGDILAFMDDDAVAEPGWLKAIAQPFSDPRVVAVGGSAVPLWINGGKPPWFPEELYWVVGCTFKGIPVKGREMRNVMGCNMAFRAEVFSRVGFFGTGLGRVGAGLSGACEETELCLRIRQSFPKSLVVFEPKARVRHKVPPSRLTLRYLLLRSWEEGFHKAMIMRMPIPQRKLSPETEYLRHLLLRSIPSRLTRPYHRESLSQAAALMGSIAATGAGFLWGHIKGNRGWPRQPSSRG